MISPDLPVGMFIVLVARLSLALFFLPSALGKLANQRGFIQGIIAYQILPKRIARGFGFILPWVELALALALICGIALFLTGLATILLLLCFIAAMAINLRRGREIACSCYGVGGSQIISWGAVARNILLLLLVMPLLAIAPNVLGLDQLLALWNIDSAIFFSPISIILLALMIAFCFVMIELTEWMIHIYSRANRLKVPLDE